MTKTIRVSVTVAADESRAFAAYTDPEQIKQWLSEGAEVDLDGGTFALWGPSIPDVPESNDGRMSLVEAEPDRRLQVAWKLLDDDTTFTVTFKPQEDATRVEFEHTGIVDNDWAWAVGSFWATQAENLRAWIERGISGSRFDYRTMGPGDIEVSAEIDAPAGEVYNALIDPEMVGRWMMSDNVTIEPEIGGDYDLAGWIEDGPVKIVDLDTNERLAYSWRSDWVGHETLVTWELAESAGKTRLTLVHSGFAPDANHDSYRTGWHGFLVQIKYLVEEGPERSTVDWEIVDAVAV